MANDPRDEATLDPLVDPPADLLATATTSVPRWLRRVVFAAADQATIDTTEHGDAIEASIAAAGETCLRELADLLDTDVDAQRTNPLSLIRRSVEAPSRLLVELGATPPAADQFHRERFPDDPFALGPSNWNEVDDELHAAGITWGAWKAMTVLRRRRDEGRSAKTEG